VRVLALETVMRMELSEPAALMAKVTGSLISGVLAKARYWASFERRVLSLGIADWSCWGRSAQACTEPMMDEI